MPTTAADRERFRKNYLKNKEYYKAYSAKWWKDHPELLRAKWRRRYQNHPERAKAQRKAYRARHLDEVRARNRKWQSDKWAHRQQYMRAHYQKNKAKIIQTNRKYQSRNKARLWHASQKRRALIAKATINLKSIEMFYKEVRARETAYCYYCGIGMHPSQVHFDHIIPLAKGGMHCVENLCVACTPCNLSKHDTLLSRWTKLPQMFLNI